MFLYDPKEQFEYFFLSAVVREAVATSLSTAIMHPLDCAVIKSALAIGKENDQVIASGGVFTFLRNVHKTYSFQGLYVGFYFRVAALFYEKFLLYSMKLVYSDHVYPRVKQSGVLAHAVDQGFICVLWGLTYPLYTVTGRLMKEIGEIKQRDQDIVGICREIWEVEGMGGFYKGGLVNLALCLGLNLFGFLVKVSEKRNQHDVREELLREFAARNNLEGVGKEERRLSYM